MLKKIIPHICIILAIVMLTLLILVKFNMWIMDTEFYSIIMYLFFASVFIASGFLIAYTRRE